MDRSWHHVRAAFLVAATLSLLCSCPSGSGGGGGGGGTTTPAPNQDKTLWGHFRDAYWDWSVTDSYFIAANVPIGTAGRVENYFKIGSVVGTVISTTFEKQELDGAVVSPKPSYTDINFVRRSTSVLQTYPSATGTGFNLGGYLVKALGADSSFAGNAVKDFSVRALVSAAGISLVITNVLNSADTRTVQTTTPAAASDPATFAAANIVPTDPYSISIVGSSAPAVIVVPGYQSDNVGTVTKPAAGSYTMKVKQRASYNTSFASGFIYADRETIVTVTFVVTSNGSARNFYGGETRMNFNGAELAVSGGYSPYTYPRFYVGEMPGGVSDDLETHRKIPQNAIDPTGIPDDPGYLDVILPFEVWCGYDYGVNDVFVGSDKVYLRFFKDLFTARSERTSGVTFTLITPDKRTLVNPDAAAEVAMMKGVYMAIFAGSGSYRFGPGAPNLDSPSNVSSTVNDDPSSATSISYAAKVSGTLDASNPVDCISFTVP